MCVHVVPVPICTRTRTGGPWGAQTGVPRTALKKSATSTPRRSRMILLWMCSAWFIRSISRSASQERHPSTSKGERDGGLLGRKRSIRTFEKRVRDGPRLLQSAKPEQPQAISFHQFQKSRNFVLFFNPSFWCLVGSNRYVYNHSITQSPWGLVVVMSNSCWREFILKNFLLPFGSPLALSTATSFPPPLPIDACGSLSVDTRRFTAARVDVK